MNKKEQQAQRAKQEDVVLNKVLWWIVGAVVLEALLLLLNKVYANYTVEQIELAKSLRDVFSVLMIALPICFVVLLIWAVAARKSGKFTRLSSVLAGVMLALAVCAVVIRVFDESGIRLLYVAVPAVAVLALIYYLYQREFFFAAVLSALGLLGVKVVPYHFGFPAIAYGYAVVLGVALVGAVVVFRVMQAAGGKLRLKGNWVEVLPKSANYALLYVTCGVVAAVVIAALLLRGPATVVEGIADAARFAEAVIGAPHTYDIPAEAHPTEAEAIARKGILRAPGKACCEGERCLSCDTVCQNCVDVCPNRANVAVRLPDGRTEIVHVDKMCNECGNCTAFCPYASEPCKDKLTLFQTTEDMDDSKNFGFCFLPDGKVRARLTTETVGDPDELPADAALLVRTIRDSYSYLYR